MLRLKEDASTKPSGSAELSDMLSSVRERIASIKAELEKSLKTIGATVIS
jgi:hypothetical protein